MSDRYAVIGHPIAHSLSPFIHAWFARACGQDLTYEALDGGAAAGGFEAAVAAFVAAGGRGMNVTLPFKLRALALADGASKAAQLAGAANALRFGNGRIEAHNFDGAGLARDIAVNLREPLRGRHVLLLGAGGATRGALLPLAQAGVASLTIANRTADKAEALAAEFAPHVSPCPVRGMGLAALKAQADVDGGGFDIVINATSASLQGHAPAVPGRVLAAARLAYDMVYGARPTAFMQAAQAAGCPRQSDGLGMLLEQAAESFAWWRGARPDTQGARAAVLARLGG